MSALRIISVLYLAASAVNANPRAPSSPPLVGELALPARAAGALPSQLKNRPSLIDYDPFARAAAVVTSPDGHARFSVLTDRVIRMEYSDAAGAFEDHATIAIMNRNTTVPVFTSSTSGGVLVIRTTSVELSYRLGERFTGTSLSVSSLDPASAFKGWAFGQHDSGNLLGTIRGLDEQSDTDLNCTLNALTFDNGEYNHCAWGMVSRDGWVAYDDHENYILDENDWWVPNANGTGTQQNRDAEDLYGFFHGHDYAGALADFTLLSGKTIMVPRYAGGVWWSRWFDVNNKDVLDVVEKYDSNRIPLDVFVLDMDWHTKDAWGGWTFDSHLFPFPADSMESLKQLGLPVTLNTHDAQGVNSWDAMFPAIRDYLGLPSNATIVPLNLVNATVAYAVSDIVWGDLVYNKSVAFAWPDWQQGGTAGGMTGLKQNPTIWLAHLRCTDRHRIGDDTRAMFLGRWGGLGGHRYQVGFSGDVSSLTWQSLRYQPYFSATSANVAHGFWSHDIIGPAEDMEMYTRWLQVGAYSGTMRSHDRGKSGGVCADTRDFSCSIVEPWNIPRVNFPVPFHDANRDVLQARATLLPYIYNGHRAAFDTGLGLIRPMYYAYPELDLAYAMDNHGHGVQYMFGPSILFSPVVTPSTAVGQQGMGPGLAQKSTWLPPGTWFDACSGVLTTVTGSDVSHMVTKNYSIAEVPLFFAAGAVIPYVPIRSFPSLVGNAGRQYSFLGFKVVPGSPNGTGSEAVYEDDGSTTAYLTSGAYAWTTGSYAFSPDGLSATFTVSTEGSYPELPATRAYQIRFLNSPPITAVTANGATVAYNRFGRTASNRRLPPASQFYWDYSLQPCGMGGVVDVVGVSTGAPLTITVTFAPEPSWSAMAGVYGAVTHALWAKGNLDIDRSTPGSNSDDPAYTSVLSSVGLALEYQAGTDLAGFAATVASVPALLANATSEVAAMAKEPRASYSLALLQWAMV